MPPTNLALAIEDVRDAAARGDRPGLIGGLRKLAEWLKAIDLSSIEALLDALLGAVGGASTLDASLDEACAEAAGVAAAWDGTGAVPPSVSANASAGDLLRVLRKLLALLAAFGVSIPGLPTLSAPEPAPEAAAE